MGGRHLFEILHTSPIVKTGKCKTKTGNSAMQSAVFWNEGGV